VVWSCREAFGVSSDLKNLFGSTSVTLIHSPGFRYCRRYFPNVKIQSPATDAQSDISKIFSLLKNYWLVFYLSLDLLAHCVGNLRVLLNNNRKTRICQSAVAIDCQSLEIHIWGPEFATEAPRKSNECKIDIHFINLSGLRRSAILRSINLPGEQVLVEVRYNYSSKFFVKRYNFNSFSSVSYTRNFLMRNLVGLILNDLNRSKNEEFCSEEIGISRPGQHLEEFDDSDQTSLRAMSLAIDYFLPKLKPWKDRDYSESEWGVYLLKDDSAWEQIPNPPNRWLADPHLFSRFGKTRMLVEDFDVKTKKGRIAELIIENGIASDPRIVLDHHQHVSFPQTFLFRELLWMTVECHSGGGVPIYNYCEDDETWNYETTVLTDKSFVDPLIFEFGDVWYLLATEKAFFGEDYYSKLLLYFANDPISNTWREHPCNPIYFDNKLGRNAGLIRTGNAITRVAQENLGGVYGKSISFRKLVRLSTSQFSEIEDSSFQIAFPKELSRIHSFTKEGDLIAIDGKSQTLNRLKLHRNGK
jgi:hypothetical protein